ncbi:MAG: zf-HC2 domain-containing protein, partial [Sedimentisphaerales bacterium]|nr:zf-HC2 domain-containing protein [Sedimentisphaerales bacterium]
MRDRLVSLVLGELPEREDAEVRAHAAGCEPCRAELSWLEQLLGRAERRRDLSAGEAMHASAQDALFAAARSERESKTIARPAPGRAFAWRTIMTGSFAKIAVAAVVAVVVGLIGLSKLGRTPPGGPSVFGNFTLLAKACAAEETLFAGADIIHIQNEIIVQGRGGPAAPEGMDHTWLPMCSLKADGSLRFDQLKLSIQPESYVVTDHSWYDPGTGCFARVLKTGGRVFFANSYDGQSVYVTAARADGTLELVGEAVGESFVPPQSPAEYLGLAAGLKTSLTEETSQVLSVEQAALSDGAPVHIYKVGTPGPDGQLSAWWLFRVRDEDATIAEKEFVVSGRSLLLIRRVLTEPVEAPEVSWNLDEIETLIGAPEAGPQVSVMADMVIPRVSAQHMVERADFETYVFKTRPAWTGDIEITDCIDPASPGGRMFIMTARAEDGRHLVLVQSPTYNKMLGNVVKQGKVVYT